MEQTISRDEQIEKLEQSSFFIEMIPAEIQLNILEFVLGVNPKLIEAQDIFEAFEQAKLIVQENGNRFAAVCTWFKKFEAEEFPKIAKKNLKNYLAQHWAQEYLGKNGEELNQLFKELFLENYDRAELIKAAKLICAGVNLKVIVEDVIQYLNNFVNWLKARRLLINIYNSQDIESLISILLLNIQGHEYNLLIFASQENLINLVKFLLQRKIIEINKTDSFDYSALDYSQAHKYEEITQLLLKAGAIENSAKVASLVQQGKVLTNILSHA